MATDFLNFGFLKKFQKIIFFRKMITKSKIKIFRNICCRACGLQPVCFSTRAPKSDVFVFPIVPNDDVIHLNAIEL